jgi:hypothetical protein
MMQVNLFVYFEGKCSAMFFSFLIVLFFMSFFSFVDLTSLRKEVPHFAYPYNPLLPLLSVPSPLSSSLFPILRESDLSTALDIADSVVGAASPHPSSSSSASPGTMLNVPVVSPYFRDIPKDLMKSLLERAPSTVLVPFPQNEFLRPSLDPVRYILLIRLIFRAIFKFIQ